jgi:TonB family protein
MEVKCRECSVIRLARCYSVYRKTMRLLFRLGLLLAGAVSTSYAGQRVVEDAGRLILEDSSGTRTVLTKGGHDSDPWTSPDGRSVLFIRHAPDDVFQTSVYELTLPTQALHLIYAGPARYEGRESSYFGRPEFDDSHETLYLLSSEAATFGTLFSVRLADGTARMISDRVVSYDVVGCGKFHGDLIALKRFDSDILGLPYFLYWLYSASGEDLGLAGAGELDEGELLAGFCDGLQPIEPLPPSVTIIPTDAISVSASEMERRLITRVEPNYPAQALSDRLEGEIHLKIRVGADGTVQEAHLISGQPQLVAAAVAAVKQWKYRPVIASGHPVAVETSVTVKFRLPHADK